MSKTNLLIFSFITQSFEQVLTLLSSDKFEDNIQSVWKTMGQKIPYRNEIVAFYNNNVCLCKHPEKNSSLLLIVASSGMCIRMYFSFMHNLQQLELAL